MTSNKLVSGLAAVALLALASCSSEPSDWRPGQKVSVDMVAPGTRSSDNFDMATDAPSQHKGGAIENPISDNDHSVPQTLDAGAGKPDRMTAQEGQTAEAREVEGGDNAAAAKAPVETQHDLNDKDGEQKQR
ncbi:hypothetical protein GCM10027048_06670 [Hymenobacter coalescens]